MSAPLAKTVWKKESVNAAAVAELARDVLTRLQLRKPFVLWIQGPLGAGKTTLVREMLYLLGLQRSQPVTSPTFSYFNEYLIGGERYYHCDFYRGDSKPNWEEIGIEWNAASGFFIEWPEAVKIEFELIPTHILNISYSGAGALSTRCYEFLSIS